jgi:hypothetical protein
MRLPGAAFNRFLGQMGNSFAWRRSYACPCVSRQSGAANPKCIHCHGKGRQWTPTPTEGIAGRVSQNKQRQYAVPGIWDQDDIMLSIPSNSPLYGMGQFDRIDALNHSEPFSMNLIRGMNDVLRLPVISLERCFYLDMAEEIHEAALPVVALNGTLSWPNGGAPPAGVTFSLTGRRRPEYFCWLELPTDRPMHFGEKLPRKVVLRRFDLFGR